MLFIMTDNTMATVESSFVQPSSDFPRGLSRSAQAAVAAMNRRRLPDPWDDTPSAPPEPQPRQRQCPFGRNPKDAVGFDFQVDQFDPEDTSCRLGNLRDRRPLAQRPSFVSNEPTALQRIQRRRDNVMATRNNEILVNPLDPDLFPPNQQFNGPPPNLLSQPVLPTNLTVEPVRGFVPAPSSGVAQQYVSSLNGGAVLQDQFVDLQRLPNRILETKSTRETNRAFVYPNQSILPTEPNFGSVQNPTLDPRVAMASAPLQSLRNDFDAPVNVDTQAVDLVAQSTVENPMSSSAVRRIQETIVPMSQMPEIRIESEQLSRFLQPTFVRSQGSVAPTIPQDAVPGLPDINPLNLLPPQPTYAAPSMTRLSRVVNTLPDSKETTTTATPLSTQTTPSISVTAPPIQTYLQDVELFRGKEGGDAEYAFQPVPVMSKSLMAPVQTLPPDIKFVEDQAGILGQLPSYTTAPAIDRTIRPYGLNMLDSSSETVQQLQPLQTPSSSTNVMEPNVWMVGARPSDTVDAMPSLRPTSVTSPPLTLSNVQPMSGPWDGRVQQMDDWLRNVLEPVQNAIVVPDSKVIPFESAFGHQPSGYDGDVFTILRDEHNTQRVRSLHRPKQYLDKHPDQLDSLVDETRRLLVDAVSVQDPLTRAKRESRSAAVPMQQIQRDDGRVNVTVGTKRQPKPLHTMLQTNLQCETNPMIDAADWTDSSDFQF